MNRIAATADIISAIYLLIIIIGVYHIKDESPAITRAYKICIWVCFTGLIVDAGGYLIIPWIRPGFVFGVIEFLPYFWFDIMILSYNMYLVTLVKTRNGQVSGNYQWMVLAACAIDLVFLTGAAATGRLFTIRTGEILYGPLENYVSVMPTVCLVIGIAFLLRNSRVLGFRDLIILSLYFLLQGFIAVLWLFDITIISGYVGFSMAMTIIFVLIQFRVISESDMKAEIFNALSSHDVLTGLKNRRSYETCLSEIAPDTRVCAIFCDINGLKSTNDRFGHEAGDKLIIKMAELLRTHFADDEVFRISGDEFVVIIQNQTEKAVSESLSRMKQIIMNNDRIASIGYTTGEGRDILTVVREAEKKMYEDKEVYYRDTGRERRYGFMRVDPESPRP